MDRVKNDPPSGKTQGGAMGETTVWFMDARSRRFLESTVIKGRQILEFSGWLHRLKPRDIVVVKTHMGESYNVGYLRPIIVRTFVDAIKERGCKPFVTDTTTMPYHPWISRTLAIDHLETANRNGFTEARRTGWEMPIMSLKRSLSTGARKGLHGSIRKG